MTKSELIKTMQNRFATYPAKDIAFACNNLFDLLTGALQKGERVEIRGFGVLSVRSRKDKTAKNPQDGSPVQVPAKRVPFFKMALEIKKGLLKNHDDL